MRSGHELLEGEGRRRRWWGLGLQHPHELLVALAGLEGLTALRQGGEGAGATLGLRPSKPKQSQGHLRRGWGAQTAVREGQGLTFRDTSAARAWGRGEQ